MAISDLHIEKGGKMGVEVEQTDPQRGRSREALAESREARIARLLAADRSPRAELRVGSNICQCQGCGLFFSGVAAFDRHLILSEIGRYRCRGPEEMLSIYMEANKHGVWTYGKSVKEVEGE